VAPADELKHERGLVNVSPPGTAVIRPIDDEIAVRQRRTTRMSTDNGTMTPATRPGRPRGVPTPDQVTHDEPEMEATGMNQPGASG